MIRANEFDPARVLAVVLARGGSLGIPRKNLQPLEGKPLIVRGLETLSRVTEIHRIVVSTDDAEIAQQARNHGADVPFLRPSELASNHSTSAAALRHAVSTLTARGERAGVTLLYQITSPFCDDRDVRAALELFRSGGGDFLRSVTPVQEHPHWMGSIEEGRLRFLQPAATRATRRQDLPPLYRLNGAISIYRTSLLLSEDVGDEPIAYVMPLERSLDLDDQDDWIEAERRLAATRELRRDERAR